MSATVTPATKIEVVELAIREVEDDSIVGVRFAANVQEVQVAWFCGDKRTFTLDDFDQVAGHLEAMAAYPDVWVQMKDTHGRPFAAHLTNGRLYADTTPADGGNSVSWVALTSCIARFREDS